MKDSTRSSADRRGAPARASRRRAEPRIATVLVFCAAAIGVVAVARPRGDLLQPAFAAVTHRTLAGVGAGGVAFGASGEVRTRVVMPGADVEFPLEVHGDPTALTYRWLRVSDQAVLDATLPIAGATVRAPDAPGLYRLELVRDSSRSVVPDLTVAVMVPFAQKVGAMLGTYRIGTYLAERLGGHDHPEGFVRVDENTADLPLSKHFRLSDFLVHDGQDSWPRYTALSPRLLDKLELVLAAVDSARGNGTDVSVDVHSGFRSPDHNRTVVRSAKDSRHQYGDAADVTIDANFDGRYTLADTRLVAAAVERVEAAHPDLVGGMGLYTSRRYPTPYVHIDARGNRARWHG